MINDGCFGRTETKPHARCLAQSPAWCVLGGRRNLYPCFLGPSGLKWRWRGLGCPSWVAMPVVGHLSGLEEGLRGAMEAWPRGPTGLAPQSTAARDGGAGTCWVLLGTRGRDQPPTGQPAQAGPPPRAQDPCGLVLRQSQSTLTGLLGVSRPSSSTTWLGARAAASGSSSSLLRCASHEQPCGQWTLTTSTFRLLLQIGHESCKK